MRVVHGYKSVPETARNGVVAIGNFDGVHRGHRALLERAIGIGQTDGMPAGALLFEPHPREFFNPGVTHFRLTPLPLKLSILNELGLDFAVVLEFNAAMAAMPASEFIDKILVDALAVRHVVIGHDFRFGHRRAGDASLLSQAGANSRFQLSVVDAVGSRSETYSSTAVRALLEQGDVGQAAAVLGYNWRVRGVVIGGAKRGTGLGYPTANIELPRGTQLAHGIYAVRIRVGGQTLDGAAYLGTRPTFDDGAPVLEVFLFDFAGDLYGQEIDVEFVARLRGDQRFDTAEELAGQMELDCAMARAELEKAKLSSP